MNDMLSDRPFDEVAALWLAEQKISIRPISYGAYRDLVTRYILPHIGQMKTRTVTDSVVEELTAALSVRENAPGLKGSTLNSVRGLATRIVEYAREKDDIASPKATIYERKVYAALSPEEVGRICLSAVNRPCRETLAVLLMLFSGLRMGEMCALSCDDISLDAGEMNIHRSVQRIKAIDGAKGAKTSLEIFEIATKSHIRTEKILWELMPWVKKFYRPGTFLLTGTVSDLPEPRTFRNRIDRIFDEAQIHDVSFQRIRKTYAEGKAAPGILSRVFVGKGELPGVSFNRQRLVGNMQATLPKIRKELGLGIESLSELSGIGAERLSAVEEGTSRLRWGEFLPLLFIFWMNDRSREMVESRGLFPAGLREAMAGGAAEFASA